MAKEIERKFLVADSSYREGAKKEAYLQGYICAHGSASVRVRVVGSRAYLNIKGKPEGISRDEYEYEIPVNEACEMLDRLCGKPIIEKTRYKLTYAGNLWEVDEFHGANKGLVVAEIELPSETYDFEKPLWLGEEVSYDPRYLNTNLVRHPYQEWGTGGKQ